MSPGLELNFTLHSLRHKIKGIKVSMIFLFVMPFLLIDPLRLIPKVYLLVIICSSLILVLQKKETKFIYTIDKNHLLFSVLFIALFFSMNLYQSILIVLVIFHLYYLGTD